MRRQQFLSALGIAPLIVGSAQGAPAPWNASRRLNGALVLSGGGARGAYQAGAIQALVEAHGVRDGEKIPGIDVVCGASIGALNGWMVATAQYSRLSVLWKSISRAPLFVPKRQYDRILDPDAGIATRLFQAIKLQIGLVTDERGVLDPALIKQMIAINVDPATPLVVPLVFSVTNLTRGTGELFYRQTAAPSATAQEVNASRQRVREVAGQSGLSRPATDDVLHDAIRASATLPILFDPVTIEGENGPEDFIDGGIANNSPIDVGRALAKTVYTMFLDPRDPGPTVTPSAVAIGMAAFGVVQHRVVEVALRSAYVETKLKRHWQSGATPEEQAFLEGVFDVDLYVMHPEKQLPADVANFADQAAIDATFDIGYQAGKVGWKPYSLSLD